MGRKQRLRRVVGFFTLATTLFFIPATSLFAQDSLFDPTWKSGLELGKGSVYGIVVQDDGKIIVGGGFDRIVGHARTNLARLNNDGTLDETFPQGTDGPIHRLLKQSDGKILVAGAYSQLQGVARSGIGRILTNGLVDPDFDAGAFLPENHFAFALAVQSDQEVLVGTTISAPDDSRLFRLNPDGQLDPSFVQTNAFGLNYPWAIVPRTNGSILLGGGFQSVNGMSSPGLALLKTNGEVDLSFVSPLNTNYSGVYSVVTLPDNSFLICGKFWRQGSTNRLAVARLSPTLEWDMSFQANAFDSVPQLGTVMTALRQPDGKFVLGGHFEEVGGYWRRGVVRLDSAGRVDSCFDPGLGLAAFQQYLTPVMCLALQTDGKVLVGGPFINLMSDSHGITRLLPLSECGVMRVHLNMKLEIAGGTCPPGGTNHLEWSTNCVDWERGMSSTRPYVFSSVPSTLYDKLFFRVRKEY